MTVTIINLCYLDVVRNQLVDSAINSKSDYFLFLDADQVYPDDTPERLMKHIDSGKMVVGGITPKRDDASPLMYKAVKDGGKVNYVQLKKEDLSGMMKCDAMGMGGVMVNPEVFNRIPRPYFKCILENDKRSGEDLYFYTQCLLKGVDVWCDTDLKYGHVVNVPVEI